MKAAVIHKLGEIPKFEDFADPVAGQEGQAVAQVKAVSIKNIDKALVSGAHYSRAYSTFPAVVGLDGVGVLPDGRRVVLSAVPGYGTLGEKTLVVEKQCLPIPDEVDDATAAALPNPGLSAWLALNWRGQLQAGETVLVLGATGFTGKLAVQLAKQLGAGRIIAAGRNPQALEQLLALGADSVISLAQSDEAIQAELLAVARQTPFDVIVDYVWGHPAEVVLEMLVGHEYEAKSQFIRYVQVGAMAGANISLPAAVLRGTNLTLSGLGIGSIPREQLVKIGAEALPNMLNWIAQGKIQLETTSVPLRDVEQAWQRTDLDGKRLVIMP